MLKKKRWMTVAGSLLVLLAVASTPAAASPLIRKASTVTETVIWQLIGSRWGKGEGTLPIQFEVPIGPPTNPDGTSCYTCRDLPMMMQVLYPEVDLEVVGAPTGNDTRIFPGMPVVSAQGRYRVECTSPSADEMSADPDEATPVTLSGLPETPSHLRASQVTSTTITLSWQDNSDNEQGFTIGRWVNGGWWTQIIHVEANVTMCRITGLTPHTIYAFRIQAFNADGVSEYSQAVTAATKDP